MRLPPSAVAVLDVEEVDEELEEEAAGQTEHEEVGAGAGTPAAAAAAARSGGFGAAAAGFNANQAHRLVIDKRREDSCAVRTTTNTRDHCIGTSSNFFEALRATLATDDALKITHHHGERMRSHYRANHVVRVAY
jgi:hypothetical protein